MSNRRDERLFLEDITDSIQVIETFVEGMTLEDFKKDRKTFSASIRELEIIGEAVNNISEELKREYSQVLWQEIRSFRNKIVHEYFGIDHRIVWDIITNELPILERQVMEIKMDLKDLSPDTGLEKN
jgi:uncharacterized protein with HEPN domain